MLCIPDFHFTFQRVAAAPVAPVVAKAFSHLDEVPSLSTARAVPVNTSFQN